MIWEDELLERLKEKRQRYDTLTDMAADASMNIPTLYRIINGKRGIGGASLSKILAAWPELHVIFIEDGEEATDGT